MVSARVFLLAVLLAVSFYDLRSYRIPDLFVIPIFVCEVLFCLYCDKCFRYDRLILFLFVFLVLFFISKITGGFGMGDVKLLSVLSYVLGFRLFVITLFSSSVFGILYAVFKNKISKIKNVKIPFAPFITAGTGISFIIERVVL